MRKLRSRSVSTAVNTNSRKPSKPKKNMAGGNDDAATGSVVNYSNNDIMAVLLQNQGKLAVITRDVAKIQHDITELSSQQAELTNRVDDVEGRLSNIELEVNNGDDCINQKLELTLKALRRTQISSVNAEFASMQYNVIVYNMRETLIGTATREKQADSINHAYYVLEKCFGLPNARSSIPLSTAHRLPATKGRSPLIFKLGKLSDKQTLWDNISHIKAFNNSEKRGKSFPFKWYSCPKNLPMIKAPFRRPMIRHVMMVYHLNGDSTKSQDNIVTLLLIFTTGPRLIISHMNSSAKRLTSKVYMLLNFITNLYLRA